MFSIQAPEYKLFLKAQYDFYAEAGRGYRFMQAIIGTLRAQSLSKPVDSLVLNFCGMLDRCQWMNDCIQREILCLRMTLSQPEQIILDHLSEAPCLPLENFQKALDQQQALDRFIEEEHTWMWLYLKGLLKEKPYSKFQSLVLELQDYLLGFEPIMRGLLNLYLKLKDYGSKVPTQSVSSSNPLRAFNQASVLRQYLARGETILESQASMDAQALRMERLRKACEVRVPAEIEEAPEEGWAEDFDVQGDITCLF